MTTLASYLISRDGKLSPKGPALSALAHSASCAPGTLYLIALGHRKASHVLAGRIERATNKAVLRGTIRPDIFNDQHNNDEHG